MKFSHNFVSENKKQDHKNNRKKVKDMINKILFVTLSNIGDAIMTTPVLQALHELYPEAVIDIVGDQRSSEIFKYCPYRGRILHKQKNSLRCVLALVVDLWVQSYDLIIDLRTDGLAYLLPAGKRYTKLNKIKNSAHEAQRHMSIISKIYHKSSPQCHVWISDAERKFAKEALRGYYGKKLLGVGVGAASSDKIWSKENYLSLVEKTSNDFDAIVFLGNSQDKKYSDYISSKTKGQCVNLCGMTSLLEAAAVLQCLTLFVGNDSGLGHIAGAVDILTITLFGKESSPLRYRPWGRKSVWLQGRDSKMESIKPADVLCKLKNLTI